MDNEKARISLFSQLILFCTTAYQRQTYLADERFFKFDNTFQGLMLHYLQGYQYFCLICMYQRDILFCNEIKVQDYYKHFFNLQHERKHCQVPFVLHILVVFSLVWLLD